MSNHKHHHPEKATEVLKQEHRVIERVLEVVGKLADSSGELSIGQWKKAVEFIRGFADQCHHLKEEKLLFPAMEQHGVPNEGGPIGMMLAEHEEGRGYVRAMAAALADASKNSGAAREILIENAKSYLRLLREHIRKEDEVLFVMADDIMTPEEQRQLAREFEEHEEKEMGPGVHDKFLKLVDELESPGSYGTTAVAG
jgi:hemerythrin-like domain-containing protein